MNKCILVVIISLGFSEAAHSTNTKSDCSRKVILLGAQIRSGSSEGGAEDAPNKLRKLGLLSDGISILDSGDVTEANGSHLSSEWIFAFERLIEPLGKIRTFTESTLRNKNFPLIIGGDHSVSLATISGAQAALPPGEELGVVIIDAHEDSYMSSPRYLHNTFLWDLTRKNSGTEKGALEKIVKQVNPENVVIIGARNWNMLYQFKQITLSEVRRLKSAKIVEKILDNFNSRVTRIHLSFDVDAIDPGEAPGVNFAISDGFKFSEIQELVTELARTRLLHSADFVEYIPKKDLDNCTGKELIELIKTTLKEGPFRDSSNPPEPFR
jgi:arginase